MAKYRKKPIVIEAVQYDDFHTGELNDFCGSSIFEPVGGSPFIRTLEGDMTISKGDWVIKGVKGEFYPIKSEIFFKTYDVVENAGRPQTFGEKAVGITFNPSGSDEVYEAKMLAAKQIDLLEKVHNKVTDDGKAMSSWVRNVLRTQAFNLLVSAQMALVKYITWKD